MQRLAFAPFMGLPCHAVSNDLHLYASEAFLLGQSSIDFPSQLQISRDQGK